MKQRWWIAGLLIALAIAVLSPLASSSPDGLERVAEDQGFEERAVESSYELVPDYQMPGIGGEGLATILAGIVGTLIMFGAALGLGWLLRRRNPSRT